MLKGKHVLVVEDEFLIALETEDELAKLGCEVINATSVSEALDIIATTDLDGATVDLKLQGQRTFQVADALAARGIPFVFATAMTQGDTPTAYAGIPWLQKPTTRGAVGRALSEVMWQRAQSEGPAP